MADDDEVRAQNLALAWSEITGLLTAAQHLVAQAQERLGDVNVGRSDWADALQPLVDDLRRAANEAQEQP